MHATLPRLATSDFPEIRRRRLETLQVNLGYKCNQTCLHCHVNAGPTRTEMMSRETVSDVIAFLKALPVMCRSLVSVDWRGYLYDCDFNQMLGLPLQLDGTPRIHLRQLSGKYLEDNPIVVKDHCYGCAAGQGSSCGGALV
jgi:MoaA/NifB/PqqE/SkfB family radical SAM enzyme